MKDTRTRILDATFDCIATSGLTGLALEDVAARAGVSRQTLYRHFGSRERLVETLVLREERWFVDRVSAAAEPHETADAAIAAGVTEALHAATQHPLLRRLLETEPGAILPLVVLGRGPVISVARPVVARLLSQRLSRAEAEVEALADVCSRLLISYVLDPGHEDPNVIGHRIARMALHGLAPTEPSGPSESDGESFTA